MSTSNFTTEQVAYQTHRGNGQFSTKKKVASQGQLNQSAVLQQAIATSPTHRSWLDDHGFTDICADEIFSAR